VDQLESAGSAQPRMGTLPERTLWVASIGAASAATFGVRHLWRWPQKALDPWWLLLWVVLAVLSAPVLVRAYRRLEFGPRMPRTIPWRLFGVALGLGLVVLLSGWLYELRPKRFYGDAGAVVRFVKRGDWFHKREPLSPAFFLGFHRLYGEGQGWRAIDSVHVVTAIAGAFGLWAILLWGQLIADRRRLLGFAAFFAVATAGTFQLFAGYIENYTVPTVFALWSLYFGTRAYVQGGSVIPAAVCFTLGAMTHLSVLTLGPGLAWLVLHRHYDADAASGKLRQLFSLKTLSLLSVTIVPAIALYFVMEHVGYLRANEDGFGGGDGLMFVPWSAKEGMSRYLFFDTKHLRAIVNLQMLVAPVALITAVAFGLGFVKTSWTNRRSRPVPEGLLPFLALSALGYFALTLIWNPDLGAKRDWDLFGPVGYYLSILAVATVVRYFKDRPGRAFAALLVIGAVNLTRTLPFVLHNMRK
jgi:hypothetical protein